ncbi:hypothetical protein GGF46_003319 [Coemansia sp. RSA 552]|nr:hypothetical protein GGF46_003319 [Coemansia sp. RSA 552]
MTAISSGDLAADEGLDGCSPPPSLGSKAMLPTAPLPAQGSGSSPASAGSRYAVESLVRALEDSASPLTCTRLAVALLSHVPADMVRLAMAELDRLLQRDFIGALPLDISLRVLEFLPAADVARNVGLVSRAWRAVATQPHLWRRLFSAQGWKLDTRRWRVYCLLPSVAAVDRALLRCTIIQAAKALGPGSDGALAPAVVRYRSSLHLPPLQCGLSSNAQSVLDIGRLPRTMDSLATATAEAMSTRLQPRSPLPPPQAASAPQQQQQQQQRRRRQFEHSTSLWPTRARTEDWQGQKDRAADWRRLYAEYHRLCANWQAGRCHIDRLELAHNESIYCVHIDGGSRLFTGSRDNTVRLWHLPEAGAQITQLATLQGHTGSVLTLQADGAMLATGSSDASACIWDLRSCTVVHRLVHPDSVLSLRFSNKWLVTACKDRVLRVWSRSQDRMCDLGHAWTQAFELAGHAVAINSVHLHGDMLVSASGDRTVRVWDLERRACMHVLDEHARGVACLDFDGRFVASGSSDCAIRVWDAATGACVRTIPNAHSDLVRTIMFDRGLDVLVSGSYDEKLKVWQFSTGRLIHCIRNAHTSRVFKLALDKTRIVSCSHDRSVAIVDFAADLPHARLLL